MIPGVFPVPAPRQGHPAVGEAGSVRVKALSGEIVYRGSINKAGTYSLKSHSGNIDMYLPASAGFDFEAETFSGGVNKGGDWRSGIGGRGDDTARKWLAAASAAQKI